MPTRRATSARSTESVGARTADDGAANTSSARRTNRRTSGTSVDPTTNCFEAVTTSSRVSRAPETSARRSVSGGSPAGSTNSPPTRQSRS